MPRRSVAIETSPEPDYRELIERLGDMIYALDLDGRFTFVNQAGLQLTGLTTSEAIGRHFREILTPASQEIAAEHFQQGVRGEETSPFFEVQMIAADGSPIDVEIRAGSLYRDGELVGRQGVARDISELKRLQAEVAEKSTRLGLIEDQARVAMDLYRRIAMLTLESPDPVATERALRAVQGSVTAAAAEKLGLTSRDLQIIELLAQGCSNREIADAVHLSPNTVKDHVSRIMRALGARSRAGVVALAARQGLIAETA
jgi:PAS domain S-box-containing protein